MNKLYTFALAAVLSAVALKSNAQDGFDELIRSNSKDATTLFNAYATPLFKGFGTGLNSGWNNTAATKKLLHFDLRITANGAFVPAVDKTFDVTKIGLTNQVRLDPTSPTSIAQTFGGDKDAPAPLMALYDKSGNKVGNFTMPDAVIHVIPAPTIQLTVGLIKNTDVTFRITPDIKVGDDVGKVGMFGIGFKHNIIKDFVPASSFDLAVAVNYNRIKYTKDLDVQPEGGATPSPGSSNNFSGQTIDATFSGTNVQAILSKKLLFFTPFISVAYQTAKTDVGVLGNYPVQNSPTTYETITNPVKINQTNVNGLRTDVGFQLNLAVFRIYASGSLGEYKSVNGGIGLGF